jgi:hypothetical protein
MNVKSSWFVRRWMPHLGLALALVLLPTCEEQGPIYRSIDLGIDERLNAVESEGYGRFAAVGSNGTFVHHRERADYRRGQVVDSVHYVTAWQLGNTELRALESSWDSEGFVSTGSRTWFVVGDGGTIYVGHEVDASDATPSASATERFTWLAQDVGTDADLYGIAIVRTGTQNDGYPQVFVVGDEVLLTGLPTAEHGTFVWTESPPPPGGWGRLRDISEAYTADGTHELRAVGEQGRMWTNDLGSVGWVAVDLDTNEDLVDADPQTCGTNGTLVTCGDGACVTNQVADVDFVACGWGWAIGSDRRIYELSDVLDQLAWQPRAADGGTVALVVVGDGGQAGIWSLNENRHVGCL